MSKPKFDEKAAKVCLEALTRALRALKEAKAASPAFLATKNSRLLDRAIVAALRAHVGAASEIDELTRQMVLPLTGKPKKRSKQLKMELH